MRAWTAIAIALTILATTSAGSAAMAAVAESEPGPDLTSIRLQFPVFASGFDQPTFVTHAGDGSGELYVVEKTGRIKRVGPNGRIRGQLFLDLSETTRSDQEEGMLSMAFHPNYPDDPRVFVAWTRLLDGALVIGEFTVEDGVADPGSEWDLLVVPQAAPLHKGGSLAFDHDGMLLVSAGEGEGLEAYPFDPAQDPTDLHGKLLRIDIDAQEAYGIPPDNGFAGVEGVAPEIHAMGFRNPWRISVDREGGHIYVGDVGGGQWEEVDVLPSGDGGLNFGWKQSEGPQCSFMFRYCDIAAYVPPAVAYPHDGAAAMIGGYAYHGTAQPLLQGVYIFGDLGGSVRGASRADMLAGGADWVELGRLPSGGALSSFGEDEAGELYAVNLTGDIHRVVAEARE